MSNKRHLLLLVGGVLSVIALLLWFSLPSDDVLVERTRDQLDLREEVLYGKDTDTPFSGILVAYFSGTNKRSAIEIQKGKAHGLSRGWYENGQLEVEETFERGVAHGQRFRWHANGQKKSEAMIVNGEITGRFTQFHQNGKRAAEVNMVAGKPHGMSLAWNDSGNLVARVELNGGEIVHQEYFNQDTP